MKRNNEEIKKLVNEVRTIARLLYLKSNVMRYGGSSRYQEMITRKEIVKEKLKEMFKNRNLI